MSDLQNRPGAIRHTGKRETSEKLRVIQDSNTVESFGFEWRWDDNPRTEADLKRRVLERCQIDEDFFKDKLVLDAGCGAGAQTQFMARYGARVIGLDLSDAVESAYKNNYKNPNVLIIQGDIANPPFKNETFDFVYSEGVLHHTVNPMRSFRVLAKLVKKGGQVACGFYTKREKGITPFLLLRQPLRAILSRLPCKLTWYICWLSVPLNKIPILNVILRKTVLLFDSNNPSNKSTWCINYDFYGPHKYQHYLKPSQILALWNEQELGLKIVAKSDIGFYRGIRV